MSSKISIQRICQYCGKEFTAKTTVTRSCSQSCARALYKQNQRLGKIQSSNEETRQIKNRPIEAIKAREFLSVRDASALIGCSRQTLYTLIQQGKIKAVNIKIKKTIILRSEIDKMFQHSPQDLTTEEIYLQNKQSPEVEYYSTAEIRKGYNISESTLRSLIIKHNIPKIRKGLFAYVPKLIIDKLLN